jgi:dihydrofolate reductase
LTGRRRATVGAMRKLIVQQWVTVDNIAAEEDGGLSFVSGEPFSETTNYWPYAVEQGEYGEKLNNLTKFVASSKLNAAPRGGFPAATVTRDPVASTWELKEQSGKDIWLWGSLKPMQSLMDAGGVDEVRMLVCPVSRGKGTRLFEDRQDLKLFEATGFENGVVLLRYEIMK